MRSFLIACCEDEKEMALVLRRNGACSLKERHFFLDGAAATKEVVRKWKRSNPLSMK